MQMIQLMERQKLPRKKYGSFSVSLSPFMNQMHWQTVKKKAQVNWEKQRTQREIDGRYGQWYKAAAKSILRSAKRNTPAESDFG